MKFLSLPIAALALAPCPALADEPARDLITIGRVERLLQKEGYRLIEIEPKDDHWEAEATRYGKTWDIKLSPKSGRVITIEQDTD